MPDFNTTEQALVNMADPALPIASGTTGSAVSAAPSRSLWQTAALGIRTLIDCDWTMRRTGAVAFIDGVTW